MPEIELNEEELENLKSIALRAGLSTLATAGLNSGRADVLNVVSQLTPVAKQTLDNQLGVASEAAKIVYTAVLQPLLEGLANGGTLEIDESWASWLYEGSKPVADWLWSQTPQAKIVKLIDRPENKKWTTKEFLKYFGPGGAVASAGIDISEESFDKVVGGVSEISGMLASIGKSLLWTVAGVGAAGALLYVGLSKVKQAKQTRNEQDEKFWSRSEAAPEPVDLDPELADAIDVSAT